MIFLATVLSRMDDRIVFAVVLHGCAVDPGVSRDAEAEDIVAAAMGSGL